MSTPIDKLRDAINGALMELEELQDTFSMRWRADMLAADLWRASAPGRELTSPDRVDLVTFLLEQLEAKDRKILELRHPRPPRYLLEQLEAERAKSARLAERTEEIC